MVETKFNSKIEKIRCDNGGEYTSHAFKNFCEKKGITIQYTVAYNPEQNGVAERFNRTIMEKARCLIFDSELSKEFWGEAVRTSIYLINRTETRVLPDKKTPAEIWNNQKPDMKKIKLFGCRAYNLIPQEMRKSKLDPHCNRLIMIGYADNGYRLWDENQRKVIHGRNVVFNETSSNEQPNMHIKIDRDNEIPTYDKETKEKENEERQEENKTDQTKEKTTPKRNQRNRKPPTYLQNYYLDSDLEEDLYLHPEMNMFTALSAVNIYNVPETYSQAIASDSAWKDAIEEELSSLEENQTWELVSPPGDVEIIDSKWVFR